MFFLKCFGAQLTQRQKIKSNARALPIEVQNATSPT
jgi:hypothetical protein